MPRFTLTHAATTLFLICFVVHASSWTRVNESSWYSDSAEIVNRTLGEASALPQWKMGEPVEVRVHLWVESIPSVQAINMSFEADLYLHLSWEDTRYTHSKNEPYLVTRPEEIDKLWRPDIYFANARSSMFHEVTVPNMYYRIYGNGEVCFSVRVTLLLTCFQNLKNYPLDKQECKIEIKSYSYTKKKIVMRWEDGDNIEVEPHIELPGMTMGRTYNASCSGRYRFARTKSFYMEGNFSCLTANFVFTRQLTYHLVQTYIPTILIVSISWISFFIDPRAIPARISLSFTTLLTLSTIGSGVRGTLPPVEYVKSIDIWMGVCTAFVFMALIQFTIVNSFVRRTSTLEGTPPSLLRKKAHYMRRITGLLQSFDLDPEEEPTEGKVREAIMTERLRLMGIAKSIDYCSRIAFPLVFAIFNVVYWFGYSRDWVSN